MFKKIIFFFVIVVFIINASCKKYPDGPLLSLHSKLERLCRTWDVSTFTINGVDSTSYLKNQIFYGTYQFLTPQGDEPGMANYITKNSNYQGLGSWDFSNRKKSIILYFDFHGSPYFGKIGPYRYGFGSDSTSTTNNITWDIMRLEEKELWLQTKYNGKQYFVKFNSI